MLLKLFEFLGLRHSPEEIAILQSANAKWESLQASNKAIEAIVEAVWSEALDKRKQLMIDNIPPDDPQWVLEVSPDIFESAQLHGFDKLAGLRLVPRVTNRGNV